MKLLYFYALREDLLTIIAAVERSRPLNYVRMGEIPGPDFPVFERGADIPGLGTTDATLAISCEAFLAVEKMFDFTARPVDPVDGVERYMLDQLDNPNTVILTPGGVKEPGMILNGRIATGTDALRSRGLLRRFINAIRRNFTKVGGYWVGPAALDRMRAGDRLTISEYAPRSFDLKLLG